LLNPLNGGSADTTISGGFDSLVGAATNAAINEISPATLSENDSFAGLKLDSIESGSVPDINIAALPEKPESTFNIANDDKIFATNEPIDEGGRETA
jgi:hypothetical protein